MLSSTDVRATFPEKDAKIIVACTAGGSTRPSANFAEGKQSRYVAFFAFADFPIRAGPYPGIAVLRCDPLPSYSRGLSATQYTEVGASMFPPFAVSLDDNTLADCSRIPANNIRNMKQLLKDDLFPRLYSLFSSLQIPNKRTSRAGLRFCGLSDVIMTTWRIKSGPTAQFSYHMDPILCRRYFWSPLQVEDAWQDCQEAGGSRAGFNFMGRPLQSFRSARKLTQFALTF